MNSENTTDGRIQDRELFVGLFGSETGSKLFGAAVRISQTFGVDLDDVTQELVIAAGEVEESYGFVHINTACFKARDAITKTSNYGVNGYYRSKGVSVDSYDKDSDDEGSDDGWVAAFASTGFNWGQVDTALSVQSALDGIEDETDRAIANGLMGGLSVGEIATKLGVHHTTVIKRRQRHLTKIFADAL